MSVFRLREPVQLLATGFGSGLSPRLPGTTGTLAALPAVPLLLWLPVPVQVLVVVAAFAFGCWLCGAAARAAGVHDHPAIVWDEFTGIWLACIALPPGWWPLPVAFVAFRILDMAKPWPISWVDRRLGGGIGIMLDDVLAGAGAWMVVQSFAWLAG
ncbi:phosphatidylglycerophosphatase A family protein [Spiribacter halobius]|uniref:Phosphatidylglycerophosphatase A n=1 Tax=Sediminicurvatus halobius TaxID=2182432 RepID=A0A2U2MZB7_9GAMM|nr:phosphatidylglycerophosphatase A [Spiribacter halobius]PWG62147.1 phosphatidylglycerophosphatase A [Spiribacter halobius]UEX77167.1 phosphatidylglycerophosphatase A [Spiribacter halobius]